MTNTNKLITPLFLSEKEIRKIIELLFFSYRDISNEPDKILSNIDFGRIHHRIIYFIEKKKNITVKELLSLLKITKQNLSRILSQLVQKEYILVTDGFDRRTKNLSLTGKGRELENKISKMQIERILKIIRNAKEADINGFKKILYELCNEDSRRKFDELNSTYE